jgi:hypothetical protein
LGTNYWLQKFEAQEKKILAALKISLVIKMDVKSAMLSSQMKIKNMFFDIGGKVICVIRWQETWPNCSTTEWKVKFTSNELRDLVMNFPGKV